jgi:hypothetical protein
MLWTLVVILLVLWLLGFSLHFAGGLIHILLVVALVMIVYDLIVRRRRVYPQPAPPLPSGRPATQRARARCKHGARATLPSGGEAADAGYSPVAV